MNEMFLQSCITLFLAVAVTADGLLPAKSYCGYQHSDDYYRNGTGIAINEFPWLAVLLYNDSSRNEPFAQCSGSLIHDRYVLTAAHCLIPRSSTLVAVRLGEYNFNNETDCTQEATFYECSEPPQNFDIEDKILHPGYSPRKKQNDVGLIRLHKRVEYSDYIRPICLPVSDTKLAQPGDILATSGWGTKDLFGEVTDTKKKILTQLITNEECGESDETIKRALTDDHLCARELKNNTEFSCQGDSGAPIIFSYRNQWHQEGILSFGKGCHQGLPEIYTRVANYMNWIKENIKP